MKRKRKARRQRKPTLGQEIIKGLEELLAELKRQRTIIVAPPAQPIIIKLPNIGDEDGLGSPVPWRPTPGPGTPNPAWNPTCFPTSFTTSSTTTTGTVRFHQ